LPEEMDKVPKKSTYDLCLANDPNFKDRFFMVTRLELNENEKCLKPYKQETEAMVFKQELPMYLLEYKKNKLLVIGDPTHMYLVDDWEIIILI
jgi:hypothetical protein